MKTMKSLLVIAAMFAFVSGLAGVRSAYAMPMPGEEDTAAVAPAEDIAPPAETEMAETPADTPMVEPDAAFAVDLIEVGEKVKKVKCKTRSQADGGGCTIGTDGTSGEVCDKPLNTGEGICQSNSVGSCGCL